MIACLLAASSVIAGPFDPPADYYDSATGTGATLKSQLHDIIDAHTIFSYGDARSILQVTDEDPNDPDRMLLVYNRVSLDVSAINPGGSIPGWDSGSSWNREHTWPRSRGVNSSGPDNSDLHQLRPSNPSVNGSRGNLNFGGEYGAQGFGSVNDGGATVWYPGDEDAGMIARQQFYMAVRYDGSDSATEDLELQSGNPSTHLGDLDRLIEWHYEAAPDDFERRRNDVIFDDYQGNRNPFVDRPEFVWSVFVDQENDTRVVLSAGSSSADGSSTQSVDLGRVYVGGAAPSATTIDVDKQGVDGTYYGVTATGDAFTDAGEHARPLATGAGVTDSFDVGLNVASTATSGVFTGTVVVDNLDVTTAGGVGVGANDGDDVVDLSFTVLDHPVASLADDMVVTSTTIDFGSVPLGSGLVSEALELFNYAGAGAPALASDLDVDLVFASGDSDDLFVDLGTSAGLAQGDGLMFDALLDTTVAGAFATDYTITLSGEDLPGELTQQITLSLVGEVVAATLLGDANNDGVVDLLDLDILGAEFGCTECALQADFNNDGSVDLLDLDILGANFGATAGDASAVPEPSAAVILLVALTVAPTKLGRGCRAVSRTAAPRRGAA